MGAGYNSGSRGTDGFGVVQGGNGSRIVQGTDGCRVQVQVQVQSTDFLPPNQKRITGYRWVQGISQGQGYRWVQGGPGCKWVQDCAGYRWVQVQGPDLGWYKAQGNLIVEVTYGSDAWVDVIAVQWKKLNFTSFSPKLPSYITFCRHGVTNKCTNLFVAKF